MPRATASRRRSCCAAASQLSGGRLATTTRGLNQLMARAGGPFPAEDVLGNAGG